MEEVKTAGGNPASISSTRGSTEQLDDRYLKLEGQVSQLKATVDSQNALIAKITSQLNFVLSFLDIENHNDGPNNTKLNQAESSSSSIGANPTLNEAALYTKSTQSFAEIVRQSVRSFSHELIKPKEVAAVMYKEQINKTQRENSFIVSGLPAVDDKPDGERIEQLCLKEFQESVNLVSCKRIGHQLPGKPRRLLVYLRSRDQAHKIIQTAKILRQSEDLYVSNNVYINPNLTEAEAKAQFEDRQRRRLKGTQNGSSNCSSNARRMNNNNLNPDAVGFTPAVSAAITASQVACAPPVPVVASQ